MSVLWRWFILRHLLDERARTVLTVLGVALGVAVFVAIRLANRSAMGSFSDTVDAVAGKANLQVSATSAGFDERWFLTVRSTPGVRAASPIVETYVPALLGGTSGIDSIGGPERETLLLLGLDPLLEPPFARGIENAEHRAGDRTPAGFDAGPGLLAPRAAAITRALAVRRHLALGDPLVVLCSGRPETLTVRALIDAPALQQALGGNLVVVDIATAQELMRRPGRLDRVDLLIAPRDRDRVAGALRRRLPPDAVVDLPAGRTRQVEHLVSAFALNLTALSFIALFVAMFLVLNAVGLSVLRWRRELGILRTLGVTRSGVAALFLGEGALLGFAGGALGALLGVFLARITLALVSRTLTDLYLVRQAGAVRLDAMTLGLGLALGVAAAVLSALAPAIEAAWTPPATTTREGATVDPGSVPLGRWMLAGAVLLVIATLVAVWTVGEQRPWGGFVSAFLTLVGFALLSPAALRAGVTVATPLLHRVFGIEGLLGARALGATMLRGSVVVSAVMVSVGMTVAMTIMVASFRRTVDTWVTQTIRGDLYVDPVGHRESQSATALPDSFVSRVRALPGVIALDSFRGTRITYRGRVAFMAGIDLAVQRDHGRLHLLGGEARPALARALAKRGCILSESFAHRFRLAVGDTLTLAVPAGWAHLPVCGVSVDYSTDAGAVFVDRALFAQLYRSDRTESLALYLAPGSDVGVTRERVLALAGPGLLLTATPNQALRRRVLDVFDQTFQVTLALQLIALIVSVLGVAGTLTALVLQRGREIAALRALGALRRQVRTMVLVESGLIGGIGALLGCVAGLALALLLVEVINRQFFGWSIQLLVDPWLFVEAVAVMVVTACLAGLAPARLAAERVASQSMRTE